jgi:hypothetical protein
MLVFFSLLIWLIMFLIEVNGYAKLLFKSRSPHQFLHAELERVETFAWACTASSILDFSESAYAVLLTLFLEWSQYFLLSI